MIENSMTSHFQYRDPLVGVLDYIAEVSFIVIFLMFVDVIQQKCTESVIAIAHDDDLELIEEVVRAKWLRCVPYVDQ
jgi:hypothetical protein